MSAVKGRGEFSPIRAHDSAACSAPSNHYRRLTGRCDRFIKGFRVVRIRWHRRHGRGANRDICHRQVASHAVLHLSSSEMGRAGVISFPGAGF